MIVIVGSFIGAQNYLYRAEGTESWPEDIKYVWRIITQLQVGNMSILSFYYQQLRCPSSCSFSWSSGISRTIPHMQEVLNILKSIKAIENCFECVSDNCGRFRNWMVYVFFPPSCQYGLAIRCSSVAFEKNCLYCNLTLSSYKSLIFPSWRGTPEQYMYM